MKYDISELGGLCRIAFDKGLIDTHSGNVSRGIKKNRLVISKTGSSLINPSHDDFTIIPIARNAGQKIKPEEVEASSEKEIHRFIIKSFPGSTVFHGHPVNAVALSVKAELQSQLLVPKNISRTAAEKKPFPYIVRLAEKYPEIRVIRPLDFESAYFFPEIFVFPLRLIEDIKTGTVALPFEAKDIFGENGVFIISSHGSFSWGKTPLDALRWTMVLEFASKVILTANK